MSYAPLIKWENLGRLDPALEQLNLPVLLGCAAGYSQPAHTDSAHTAPHPLSCICVTPSSDPSPLLP